MGEIFENYWWLLFPLGYFLAAGWGSFMRYKRTQSKIDLIKTYAAAGKEPPAELIATLDRDDDANAQRDCHDAGTGRRRGGGRAFLVVMFAGLAAVFAYAGYSGMIGEEPEKLYFVALVLGVLSIAFLAASLFSGRNKDD